MRSGTATRRQFLTAGGVALASQYWVSKALFEANFADFNNMVVIYRA